DDSQKQHAENVSRIGSTIGAALKLSETDLQKLAEAGYYHDIGKVVSDSDQHPAIGYRILNHFIKTMKLADIVLAHHEKWDGTGYPDGIDGKKIPLLSRILTVAEVYDRMIHPHTGVGCTKDAAYRKIVDGSGTCFDPDIVETFAGLYLCNRL
ncbi:MAG TPA: HD domain-containing phosphohydrolase, partial [Anaerovoracaceae bacterium]|nr:HD domain-containing phosphohydrolase [Anaerovoracaceae bacterium]